jgi:hypothetical protein
MAARVAQSMAVGQFVKKNFALIVGLALPILLMLGFMVASSLPETVSTPPRFDLVFAVPDYPPNQAIPVSVRLVVKEGSLKAQYTKMAALPGYVNTAWKKLYIYEARPRTVRELTFGFPADMNQIEGTREETVEATKSLKLDTTLQSPDGFELSYGDYRPRGLLTDIFWSGGYSNAPTLKKGAVSVRLSASDGRPYFAYGPAEFVGWVIGTN